MKKTTTNKTTVKTTKRTTAPTSPVKSEASGVELAKMIAQGMFEKKAEEIAILDLRNIPAASADFFVICHAGNNKQVEAIANSAEEEVWKHTGARPWHREGFDNLEWVLLDYFDVVAHVFLEDKREFYGVEELWGDALIVPFKGK